jgi:hypothetical protein
MNVTEISDLPPDIMEEVISFFTPDLLKFLSIETPDLTDDDGENLMDYI